MRLSPVWYSALYLSSEKIMDTYIKLILLQRGQLWNRNRYLKREKGKILVQVKSYQQIMLLPFFSKGKVKWLIIFVNMINSKF